MRGLSLVAASGGHSSSQCAGLSLSWPLLLQSTGSRRAGSVVVAHGPSCSAACGIFPDQGSNPCPLHWQADSQPLHYQGSPWNMSFNMHRTLYTLKNTPGPAHSRLVAGTADMAQKWPEVVSPRPVETEVPEVPTAALLPLLFSCQSFSCKVFWGQRTGPLVPHLGPVFTFISFSPPITNTLCF